jgi:hypothetical protein
MSWAVKGARPVRLAAQGPAQGLEVPGRDQPFGQPRGLEGEDVPAAAQLSGAAQALEEADRMGRVEDHQPLDALGVVHGQQPGQPAAPVVAGDRGRADAQGHDQVGHLLGQHPGPVVAHPGRLVGGVVAGQVGRDHPVAGVGQGGELVAPGVPELGEAVQQHHQGAGACFDAVQAQPADVDPPLGHTHGACPVRQSHCACAHQP